MYPQPFKTRYASLLGALSLAWLIWLAIDAFHAISAQRYLDLDYSFLAALTVRRMVLTALPLLLPGALLVIAAMRLIRRPRFFIPVPVAATLLIVYAHLVPACNAWMRAWPASKLLRVGVMGGLGLAILLLCWILGRLIERSSVMRRLCARGAGSLDALAVRVRTLPLVLRLAHPVVFAMALAVVTVAVVTPLLLAPPTPQGPSVVIILIDTLRADHLGTYGYSRETSPNIDRWAAQATVFDAGIAQASWTKPSVASLFTCLYPSVHQTGSGTHVRRQVIDKELEMIPAPAEAPATTATLPPGLVTVAEVFRAAGYSTGAFVANHFISRESGYGQGFETHRSVGDRRVTAGACRWLWKHRAKPFFLYLHYMAPHAPYNAPAEFDLFTTGVETADILNSAAKDSINFTGTRSLSPQDVIDLINQYDGEIRYVDDQVRRVLETLSEAGMMDHTVVVLTADHGEEFLDHGLVWHESFHLYGELVRVPLVIDVPGEVGSGCRVRSPVMQIDLGPTLFDLSGLACPRDLQGRSLASLFRKGTLKPRAAYTEALDWGWRQAIQTDSLKLIYDRENKAFELYDLTRDPGEQRPLVRSHTTALGVLYDSLEAQRVRNLQQLGRADMRLPAISREELERLRTLGYIQ